MNTNQSEHAWCREQIAAYVAGGLDDAERKRFAAHLDTCAQCGAELKSVQQGDAAMRAVFAGGVPDAAFEQRIIAGLRHRWIPRLVIHPMVTKAAAGVAAVLVLGAIGAVASRMQQGGGLPMPSFSRGTLASYTPGSSPSLRKDASNLRQIGQAIPLHDVVGGDGRFQTEEAEQLATVTALTRNVPPTGVGELPAPQSHSYPGVCDSKDGVLLGKAANSLDQQVADVRYGQAKTAPVQASDSFKPGDVTVALLGDAGRKGGIVNMNTSHADALRLMPVDGRDTVMLPWEEDGDGAADTGRRVAVPVAGLPKLAAQSDAPAAAAPPTISAPVAGPTAPAPAQPTPPAPVAQPTAPAPTQAPDIAAQRKIIRTGQMDFEVESFDSAFARIGAIVKEEGGFVASTDSQKLPNGKMTGTVTLRVVPEHLDTLVLKLRGLGDLKSQKIVAQDVTKQYTDLESELRAARAMEQRLLDIIKTGKGEIKDLVAAEKELGVWREKIEKVEGEIRYYASQIALSTLTVTLAEKDVKAAASVSETELRSIGIETDDVEKAYAAAQDLVGEFKGHVVSATLRKLEAGQFAADLVCDIAPADTGPMTDRLKQLGTAARMESERKRTTADGSEPPATAKVERKDTRFVISMYNLANIAPRQTMNVNLACRNVEDAYRAILARVTKAGGRVVGSNLNQLKADQTTASINFQVKSNDADAMLQGLRQPSEGNDTEVVHLTATENPDTNNVTTAKRGFVVQIVSLASIAPRETIKLQLAAASVPDAYKTLTGLLGGDAVQGRVLSSQLSEQDRRDVSGTLDFEVRRSDLSEIDRALKAAGDVVSRNVVRALDAENTIDSKVRVTMGLVSADRLPPREVFTMAIETANVEKAMGDLSAAATGAGGRADDSHLSRAADGQVSGRLVIDVPFTKAAEILQIVRSQGTVRSIEREKNSQVPEGSLARARLDVVIGNGEGIVSADKGVYASVRNALGTSVAGLLWSLQLIVIGLFLIGPWLVALWGGTKLARRFRRLTTTARAK